MKLKNLLTLLLLTSSLCCFAMEETKQEAFPWEKLPKDIKEEILSWEKIDKSNPQIMAEQVNKKY